MTVHLPDRTTLRSPAPAEALDLAFDVRTACDPLPFKGDWHGETVELYNFITSGPPRPLYLSLPPDALPTIARFMAEPDRLRRRAEPLLEQLGGSEAWIELDPRGPDGLALPWSGPGPLPYRVGGMLLQDHFPDWRWWPVSQFPGRRFPKALPIPASVMVDPARPGRLWLAEATDARLAGMWPALQHLTGRDYGGIVQSLAEEIGPGPRQKFFGAELPLAVLAAVEAGDLQLPEFDETEGDDDA